MTAVPETISNPSPERRATARVLYEGDPKATIESVAKATGVTMKLVQRWRAEDAELGKPWQKAQARLPDLAGRAAEAADALGTTIEQTGQSLATPAEAAAVASQAAERFAVDLRGKVLERHRIEWAGPRKLAYRALQQADTGDTEKAFSTARVAKILSETLTLVQAGERTAHGIQAKDIDMPAFIIDRDAD